MARKKRQRGSGAEGKGFFNGLAWLRLACLIFPCAIVFGVIHGQPGLRAVSCAGVLVIWLKVDAGPFRAENNPRKRAE